MPVQCIKIACAWQYLWFPFYNPLIMAILLAKHRLDAQLNVWKINESEWNCDVPLALRPLKLFNLHPEYIDITNYRL